MRPRPRHRRALSGALFLSIYLHLSLFALVALILSVRPAGCVPDDTLLLPFEVALVPEDQVILEDQTEKKLEELKEEKKKEEEKERDLKGQVVDVPPPPEEKQPQDARFLAEHDSSVQKETKGPAKPFKPGKMLTDKPLPERQRTPPAPPPEQQQVEKKALKLAMRQPAEVPESSREKMDEQGDETLQAKPKEQPKVALRGPDSPAQEAAEKRLSLEDLKLSDAELARVAGTRANDYLKDVDEGEQTLLNTKRWRFATFFNRVKRQVAENWHPDRVYRRRDPSGNVYGFRDRLTVLRVELTPQGRLKDLFLEKPSGIGFLDDEAMDAFRAAEPFPNPPQGLVDKDTGLISFRFGFLFEISNRPGFRIFRFQD